MIDRRPANDNDRSQVTTTRVGRWENLIPFALSVLIFSHSIRAALRAFF
jgi:hypothetical protein